MRKFFLLLLFAGISVYVNGQIIKIIPPQDVIKKKDTLVLNESVLPYSIGLEGPANLTTIIFYKVELITADPGDYKLLDSDPPSQLTLDRVNHYKNNIFLKIIDDHKKEATECLRLVISYPINGTWLSDTTIIKIEGDDEKAASAVKTPKEIKADKKKDTAADNDETTSGAEKDSVRLMYLNAYNFDFGNTSGQSNYVGHLNIMSPNIEDTKWGVNAGIMKINYTQDDSSINENSVIENVLINPFETLDVNSKYLKQVNSYKTQRKNTVWSIYIQPLYQLICGKKGSRIYVHGHLELLPTKWSSQTTIKNIKTDTAIFTPSSSFVARTILTTTSTYKITGLYGYFGLGLTFDLKLWDNSKLFFQPTIGKTTNFPQPASIDINSALFPNSRKQIDDKWSTFYLFRAYLMQKINNDLQIIVGADIRGIFPLYAPLYAAYAGLNLNLQKVVDLIK